MAGKKDQTESDGLLEALKRVSGQVADGTLELARNTATMTAMFGENWLRNTVRSSMEPERLEAMADAGRFLRDARETAGLSRKELSESLGLSDKNLLQDVESGETIMPLELVLRTAALVARHDPIPFLIKFLRTYNPSLEQTLEQWGVMALPKRYERERRFVNLYRQYDVLRSFDDQEFERFADYMQSSISLVIDVMQKEKAARTPQRRSARTSSSGTGDKSPKSGSGSGGSRSGGSRRGGTAGSRKKTTPRKRKPASPSS